MRISEITTPELRQLQNDTVPEHSNSVLQQIESLIKQFEKSTSTTKCTSERSQLASDLCQSLTQLNQLAPFPEPLKLHLWKLSYRLWNACVDLSNASSILSTSSSNNTTTTAASEQAKLRHVAADMLLLAGEVTGVPSPGIKTAFFYYKTGTVYHSLKKYDLASNCFEKAAELVSKLDLRSITDTGERKLLLDLNLARSRTAWEVSDPILATTMLNRAKSLLFGSSDHYKALAIQYIAFGKNLLTMEREKSNGGFKEALKLMNDALELCEKGFSTARTRQETIDLKALKSKTLRFIAAVHLQMEEFESVIKCVRVLREGEDGGERDNHPCLPVLAMKAWLGLGRFNDAEKELRGMIGNKGIPEGVWVSAVEEYFQGVGTAGVETAKGVFLGLLGRCHVSASSAIRIVHRLIEGGGEGARVRAKVVAELVSDERVVGLFVGDGGVKERKVMHAMLWNYAADYFRSKDYETSADMFEKSMLYVSHDIESRLTRAKGFRVLCLCHLGLSQLDRAVEYVNEAEKLEPNIASAFLKFKIHLQKKNYNAAVDQIQAMASCLDFTPDFLSLSAHEAVACHALPVAAAALSNLLNFYVSGKTMSQSEVVVLRTLITILTQDPVNTPEVLKFLKCALSRVSEVGYENFFGKGEVARREVKWFAMISWNTGTDSGKNKNFESCAEFLKLANKFFGLLVEGEVDDNSIMICKSLILMVCALIASENQKKVTLPDAEVKQAAEQLDKAGKILKAFSMRMQLEDDQIATIEPEFYFIHTLTSYEIHGRINDSRSQLLIVKSFASSKEHNPMHLLQIGLSAAQGPQSNPEVALFALNYCLSELLSSVSPDYQNVARILRNLLAVTSQYKGDTDDDAVYGMYKQAYRIMIGLKEGEYPLEEGKWLATTAWNRAAIPVRFGQTDVAKKWMKVGLELAGLVPGMETYRSCMEDFVNGLDKNFSPNNNGVD